jgi:hypothetical protein
MIQFYGTRKSRSGYAATDFPGNAITFRDFASFG